MQLKTNGNHALTRFDSFHQFITWNESAPDNRTMSMRSEPDFHGGVTSMSNLLKVARDGMPRNGIDALHLATETLQEIERELNYQTFQTSYNVSGCDVDVARYLSGEPENMIDYTMADVVRTSRVVTIVCGIGVPAMVSASKIQEHGHSLMALSEAIDRTGLQSEIWVDDVSVNSMGTHDALVDHSGRVAVRLKAPGESFDPGMFMFALTHAGMLRGLTFNAMHAFPTAWITKLNIGSGYGRATREFVAADDYPDGALYIPPILNNREAGISITDTLRELKLLKD
ncbi:MAG: DUF7192 family protein [Mycobacterium sp.]